MCSKLVIEPSPASAMSILHLPYSSPALEHVLTVRKHLYPGQIDTASLLTIAQVRQALLVCSTRWKEIGKV